MIGRSPWMTFLTYLVLVLGIGLVGLPLWVTLVASTQSMDQVTSAPMSLLPGKHLLENYGTVLSGGSHDLSAPVARMMMVSAVMALGIAIGKILISLISAFALIYFRFPFKNFFFWMIFITLMLPSRCASCPPTR